MSPLYRWALLILALLFVLGGAYVVRTRTGGGVIDPGSKVITPLSPGHPRAVT